MLPSTFSFFPMEPSLHTNMDKGSHVVFLNPDSPILIPVPLGLYTPNAKERTEWLMFLMLPDQVSLLLRASFSGGKQSVPLPTMAQPTAAWSPLWTSVGPKEPISSYHCDPSHPTTVTDALTFDAKMTWLARQLGPTGLPNTKLEDSRRKCEGVYVW